jgi:hypothetical protein
MQNHGWKEKSWWRSGFTCPVESSITTPGTSTPTKQCGSWQYPGGSSFTDRLDGRPISIEVRMDRQSILYTTLWLFAGAFAAAVLLLCGIIWLTIRKGAREAAMMP